MSQSRPDAQRLINNIMNYNNDINCRKAWPDFNPSVTLGIKKYISDYDFVTVPQLSALTNIDAGWNTRIQDFNFINHRNNQIVSNNKNKIHTYHKVVKSYNKNIFKTPTPTPKQGTIKAFFAKA